MARRCSLLLPAVVVAAVALGGPGAWGGPVSDCQDPGPRPHGSTKIIDNVNNTTVSTNGDDLYYQSATGYVYVSPSGAYARRFGSSAGEPANAAVVVVSSSSVCVASPALGVGYQVP